MKLHGELFAGKKVLDIGTGTGIIALYAAKLGAAKVVATDIDPRAVRNAQRNARRLGFGSVIETRLVDVGDPGAFSVIRPGEVFDIVISNPPAMIGPFLPDPNRREIARRVTSPVKLGLSILNGLQKHLAPAGRAILVYNRRYLHDLMARYALSLGYDVEHLPSFRIPREDWCGLYNVYAALIEEMENLAPDALLIGKKECNGVFPVPPAHSGACDPEAMEVVDPTPPPLPPLWGKPSDSIFRGFILVRKRVS